MKRVGVLLLLAILFPPLSFAQVQTGTPPFGSFGGTPDVINLANLNSHVTVPVFHKAGRGLNFIYDLSYDTSVWYPVGSSGNQVWTPVANYGWRASTEAATGYVTDSSHTTGCPNPDYPPALPKTLRGIYFDTFVYHDAFGISHPFSITVENDSCASDGVISGLSTDGSGMTLATDGLSTYTVTLPTGQVISPPRGVGTGAANKTDRNGNQITVNSSGVFTDTLGTTALTVAGSGTPTSPLTFTYTAPSGANAAYTMNYTAFTIKTAFGCSGISEYGPTSNSLVTEIDLPDISVNPSDKYTFTYEVTPGDTHSPHYVTGRLASVALPTGGIINYTYTGGSSGNITCSDGSAPSLARQTPDGTWAYTRTPGTGAAYTTSVTDRQGNQTVIQFQGIYETQQQVNQLVNGSQTLLQTLNICYNGSAPPCTGTAITLPITQRNVKTTLPNGQQAEHDDFWNTYGAPTETDDYDYGAAPHGSLLKKVLATYAPLGNITAFRQTVTVLNGSGAAVSKINYNYDETTPTATSGTPQHVSVSTPRGNLTSVNIYTNSTTYLTKSLTYYDTGNLQTGTDVNGGTTTYNYASGTASCYNSFPTSMAEAVNTLSRSMTWNCTGGVQLTSTDENSQTTTTSYNDPYFWRPASATDPTNAVTSFCYGLLTNGTCTLNPNESESVLSFNSGNSAVDTLSTSDALGRDLLP